MGIDNSPKIDVSTLENRFLEIVRPGLRKNPVLALLMANKRIDYSQSGKTSCTWPIRYRRNVLQTHSDLAGGVATPVLNRHKEMELPWRAYIMGEAITKYQRLTNAGGKNQLFSLVDETMKGMAADSNQDFTKKLWLDGNTTGSKDIHGFESIFSTSGTFTGDARLLTSNEVYAGITCTPGNYGGSWTGTYPDGSGNLRYHFATPCVVDYTYAGSTIGWDAAEKTWKYTWRLAMGLANTVQETLHGTPADVWITSATMLREAKDSLIDKERIAINQQGELTKLGFAAINYEGADITSAYGSPTGAAYGLSLQHMRLKSMQKKLFMKATQDDVNEQTEEIIFDFWGNLQFESPAFFCKLINES